MIFKLSRIVICKGLFLIALICSSRAVATEISMKFSLPVVNWLYHSNKDLKHSKAGAWGLAIGCESFFNRNGFWALNLDLATTYPWMPPPFVDYYKAVSYQSGISVLHCRNMKKINWGAGPSVDFNAYRQGMDSIYHSSHGVSHYSSIGLHFAGDIQLSRHFLGSLNYRPNFYSLTEDKVSYSHGFYLSLGFRTLRI